MKITYIAHACLVIETGGLKILTDPWIAGPSWGGNLWVYPPAKVTPEDFDDIDVIYFSHAHEDHFQRECVDRLPEATKKNAKTLIPDFGMPYFEKAIDRAGFANVVVMKHDEAIDLADGVRAHMLLNDREDHDSAMVLEADGSTLFLQTDSIISMDEAKRIGRNFDIDLMFAITVLTGIYPAFCELPADEIIARARQKRESSMAYALDVTRALGTKAVVPYASDLCYLGDLFHVNTLHHHDKAGFLARVAEEMPSTAGVRMGPGDTLQLRDGELSEMNLSEPDDGAEKLATFAIEMQERYAQSWQEEHSRTTPGLNDLVTSLTRVLPDTYRAWSHEPYRVLWRLTEDDGARRCVGHEAGGSAQEVADGWAYDLRIDVPAFRLRRLAHGDYPMGFLTLQNGGMRFHRHVSELTPAERDYWHALLKFRMPLQA